MPTEASRNGFMKIASGEERIVAAPIGPEPQMDITGTEGDDTLTGTPGNDVINGLGGNDTIDGSGGSDTLDGGNDNDVVTGGSGNDTLYGGDGNDVLDGGTGNDHMYGGPGDDTYYFDSFPDNSPNSGDLVFEAAGEGFDTLNITVPYGNFYTLPESEEIEVINVNRSDGIHSFTGNSGANIITGHLIDGGGGDDVVQGTFADDVLKGGSGNDAIIGGTGNDVMTGGTGNDSFFVDAAGDVVNEAAGEGSDRVAAAASWVLASGVSVEWLETITLSDTTAINLTGNELAQTIVGNNGANVLDGGGGDDILLGGGGNDTLIGSPGNDTMYGGTGDDVYSIDVPGDLVVENAGEGNDRIMTTFSYVLTSLQEIETLETASQSGTTAINLTGNDFAQTLIGNAGDNVLNAGGGDDTLIGLGGNDTLIGSPGNDTMYGGTGNDVYSVDAAGDAVFESVGEGNDRIGAIVSYALASGSEVETLEAATQSTTYALNLTGNAFNNLIVGNNGDNVLNGGGGNDTLKGLDGNDVFIGSSSASTMYGGLGNDTYYVSDSSDAAIENAGEGTDRVAASVSYALPVGSEIEQLEAITQSATTALNLAGNEFGNTIVGNNGANGLDGGGGNDVLIGLGGDDVLTGGSGTDTMYGGLGNDSYVVDNAADGVIEAAGEGSDTVSAGVSYALAAGTEVEILQTIDASGTAAINLTGNELNNLIYGNNGANTLSGGAGNDVLIGFGGNDVLNGGLGNDTYYVDDSGDVVNEAAGEGSDRIATSVNYALAAGSEVETLEAITQNATTPLNLSGSDSANTIVGNAGSNVLDGGGGNDVLIGLSGDDTFRFSSALGPGNVDTIVDFQQLVDTVALDHNVFTGLSPGGLPPGAFVIGSQAQDADDRIIYDSATGHLFFDADGNGAGAAVQFATLTTNLSISAANFMVF